MLRIHGLVTMRDFQEINYANKKLTPPDADNTERREIDREDFFVSSEIFFIGKSVKDNCVKSAKVSVILKLNNSAQAKA